MTNDSLLNYLRVGLVAVLALSSYNTIWAQDLPPGDAGPGGRSSAPTESWPVASIPDQFVIRQQAMIHPMGGGIRGFGMLAKFEAPGMQQVFVQRDTQANPGEPYLPFTVVRVTDPDGNCVAALDLTAQTERSKMQVIKVPQGKAGTYRVSVTGGRQGDRFTLGLPETDTWGIRGEMALGITETNARNWYMYAPRTVKTVIVEQYGGGKDSIILNDADGQTLGDTSELSGRRRLLVLENAPAEALIQVDLSKAKGQAVAIDGIPGLLCPTPEAAEALKGGTVEAEGLLVAGPLQARARKLAVEIAQRDLTVDLAWPKGVPGNLEDPQLEVLAWGKYSPLSSMKASLEAQILDIDSPYLGFIMPGNASSGRYPDWQTFLHGGVPGIKNTAGMASTYLLPGKLNPAHGNQAMLDRATLSALCFVISMSGEDLTREDDLRKNSYPVIHAFFSYPGGVSQAIYELKDHLDPEVREVWQQGAIAIGDKLGDYQAYQSNQWSHMMLGHLYTYLATGEERFLGYFERAIVAFFDNTWGPDGKFGQSPAGYYLEEYGPDGNYDHLSAYCLVAAWFEYSRLEEHDPSVLEKIRAGIEKNLSFKQYYWLPQPNGDIAGVNAFNCRTNGWLSRPSYPGDYMAKYDFALSARRAAMQQEPRPDESNPALTFSHIVNSDRWAMRTLKELVPEKGDKFNIDTFQGEWMTTIHQMFSRGKEIEQASLPFEEESGEWELPGHFAFKRGEIYGTVFWDVAGADPKRELNGRFGGGPTVLWNKDLGLVVGSMQSKSKFKVASPSDVTHSAVFGTLNDGSFFSTGREHPEGEWREDKGIFEVRAELSKPAGQLLWRYHLDEKDSITIEVRFKSDQVKEAWINLPVRDLESQAKLEVSGRNAVYAFNGHQMRFETNAPGDLVLSEPLPASNDNVQAIRIPIMADGSAVKIKVSTSR